MNHSAIEVGFWEGIVGEVYRERMRQDEQWGRDLDYDDPYWMIILMEEVGELAEAIIEKDENGIHDEAIQVAAVIFKFLELRVAPTGGHEHEVSG